MDDGLGKEIQRGKERLARLRKQLDGDDEPTGSEAALPKTKSKKGAKAKKMNKKGNGQTGPATPVPTATHSRRGPRPFQMSVAAKSGEKLLKNITIPDNPDDELSEVQRRIVVLLGLVYPHALTNKEIVAALYTKLQWEDVGKSHKSYADPMRVVLNESRTLVGRNLIERHGRGKKRFLVPKSAQGIMSLTPRDKSIVMLVDRIRQKLISAKKK